MLIAEIYPETEEQSNFGPRFGSGNFRVREITDGQSPWLESHLIENGLISLDWEVLRTR